MRFLRHCDVSYIHIEKMFSIFLNMVESRGPICDIRRYLGTPGYYDCLFKHTVASERSRFAIRRWEVMVSIWLRGEIAHISPYLGAACSSSVT